MEITREELQNILKAHAEWLTWKAWDSKDEETRGQEPSQGKRANLERADLQGADLRNANLERADLRWADLEGAKLQNDIPVIPDIDTKIHEAVKTCGLNMSTWHCGTTHCRAGWAIHLAGEEGYALENKVGSEVAGTLIYMASRPDKKHPDFFCSDDEALSSIEADAKGGVK